MLASEQAHQRRGLPVRRLQRPVRALCHQTGQRCLRRWRRDDISDLLVYSQKLAFELAVKQAVLLR